MKRTGFLYDERYLLHDTGPYHPETADRLIAAHMGLEKSGLLSRLIPMKAVFPETKWIESVHDPAYIRRFEALCCKGASCFDYEDNQICCQTFEIAQLAVGGVLEAARRVMAGELDNAFCAVRPPGHHAEVGQAMGFCYFNNVAIAARYLQQEWGLTRVGIIDFDVHHGNGTQHIFEKDPTVFYYSIHEHPSFAFPGTGRAFERGAGEGVGFTRNYPVLPGQGDKEYLEVLTNDFLPLFNEFKPDFILVSTGFDAHADDDMSDMCVTTQGFSDIMRIIVQVAETNAKGRLISVLEGGYSLRRLPELVANHVEILLAD